MSGYNRSTHSRICEMAWIRQLEREELERRLEEARKAEEEAMKLVLREEREREARAERRQEELTLAREEAERERRARAEK